MPRRLILSATERDTLLALPESQDDLIRYYTFNDSDLSLIRQRRGDANRLGFAVQLSLLRYPGYVSFSEDDCTTPLGEIAVVHTTVDLSLLNSCVHDLRICSKLLCTIVTSTLGMYETDRLRTPIEPRVLK